MYGNFKTYTMEKKNINGPIGFILPGCMFIGMGIGFLFNAIPVGLMIGLGTGFLITGFYKMYHSKENSNGKTI